MNKLFGLAFLTLMLLCCGIKTNTLEYFFPVTMFKTMTEQIIKGMALFPSSSLYKTYSKNGCRRVACVKDDEGRFVITYVKGHGYAVSFYCLISYLDGRPIESKEILYVWGDDGTFHEDKSLNSIYLCALHI